MRPPARTIALLLACAAPACDSFPADLPAIPASRAREQVIHLDERAVIVGLVVERLESQDYVYLRLSVTRAHDQQHGQARRGPPARAMRWVALERSEAALGDELRVRSLARRARVYDAALEREFELLDYAAAL